jgi:hypothetical protein
LGKRLKADGLGFQFRVHSRRNGFDPSVQSVGLALQVLNILASGIDDGGRPGGDYRGRPLLWLGVDSAIAS